MPRTATKNKKQGKTTSATSRRPKKQPGPSVSLDTTTSSNASSLPVHLSGATRPSQSTDGSNTNFHISEPAPSPYNLPPLATQAWNPPTGWSQYPPLGHSSLFNPRLSALNPSQMVPIFAPAVYSNPVDPTVTSEVAAPTVPQAGLPSVATSPPLLNQPPSRSASPSSSSDEADVPISTGKAKRERISRRNPKFGLVEGAMVGGTEYSIPRKKALRDMQNNKASATRRFKRQVEDLVSRSERLSVETDCWFIICAQLPGSGLAYHYTSPRLRREAIEEASAMVTKFQEATYVLNIAKRQEAKEITENYERQLTNERALKAEAEGRALAAQKVKEVAEAQVEIGRKREEQLQAELANQKTIVETYRAQLAAKLSGASSVVGNA